MLHVKEDYVNSTEGYSFGGSEMHETYFEDDESGKLFRECQKEYGRCVSKVYVSDTSELLDGEPKQIGWVFQKRVKYEDCDKTYLQEVWVTVYSEPDTVVRTHHYHDFS